MAMTDDDSGTRSSSAAAGHVMALLNLFLADNEWRGVRAMGRESGISKSAVQRLASRLTEGNFLEQNPETGQYRLGVRVFELGMIVSRRGQEELVSRELLQDLVATVGETAYVAVLDGAHSVTTARAESDQAVRAVSPLGARLGAWLVASGKVLLAGMSDESLRELLPEQLEASTAHTITSRAKLLKQLSEVRKLGWAVATEEYESGLRSIAAPVTMPDGRVVAAISVAGPLVRLNDERLPEVVSHVQAAASAASLRLVARVHG